MTDLDPRATQANPARYLGLTLAGLLLLGLIVSLGIHLRGRASYSQAAEQFASELADQQLDFSAAGLPAQLASLAPPVPGPSDNAARWLVAGAKALVLDADFTSFRRQLSATPTARWTEQQAAQAEDLVDRNRGGLDTLRRAVPCAGSSYQLDYEDLIDAEIPNLIELLNAGHLVNIDARLALAKGDLAAGLVALDILARLTDSLRRETILIFSLIAHVTERLLLQGIAEVLSSEQSWAADPQLVERLQQRLPQDDLLAVGRKMVALDAAVTSLATLQGRAEMPQAEGDSSWRIFFSGHRRAAGLLDSGRVAVGLVDQPYALSPEHFLAGGNRGSASHGLESAYRGTIAKSQLAMSQRQLIGAALEVRGQGLSQGAYGAGCQGLNAFQATDPYVGQPLVCRLESDRSFHLEVPGAAEVVEKAGYLGSFWVLELDLPPIVEVAEAVLQQSR